MLLINFEFNLINYNIFNNNLQILKETKRQELFDSIQTLNDSTISNYDPPLL